IKEFLSYREFYGGVNKLNKSLERIIEGDYSVRVDDGKEGQFYVLTKNVNRLVEIVNASISSLKEEKIFLKDIISDISHQLKTPLSTLSIYNELIEGKMLGEKEEQEILQNSRNVLDKMEWLIINLLKLAKFEVKAVEFNKSETNIRDTIEGAVRALHGKSLENDNKINITGEDVFLNIDGEWVEEGFINLIKNAIEHSKNGGEINIDISDNTVWTKITVEDFGEGIEEKDLNKIFQRFYKSKNSKPDSIGIGLSLSKSIFEGNGAKIEVSSKVLVGTKFTVTFLKI
ncbi:MAG: sensor histidine kinase, partial [Clostridium sp.]